MRVMTNWRYVFQLLNHTSARYACWSHDPIYVIVPVCSDPYQVCILLLQHQQEHNNETDSWQSLLCAVNWNLGLTAPGFPIVCPVGANVSPGPDDNFRSKQTTDSLGLGEQSHRCTECRALQSSTAHCTWWWYNTNMITYKQTRPSAHYQASSIHNCSSSASVCMWTLASSGTQLQDSDASRIWSSYRPSFVS